MSRDSNGNYSLPSSYNPVVSGTIIDPDWANVTLDDMSNGLTDSLSRTGKGGMLAPFFLYDGVPSAPGMSWISENTSGLYRAAVNDFRYSINGRDVLKLTKTGLTIFGETTNSIVNDTGLKISGAGHKYFSVESTDAPAGQKLATVYKSTDGTAAFGVPADDVSTFTKGIMLKPGDNTVYDIATNKPFLTDYAGNGSYLPLTGGAITGDLSIRAVTSSANAALNLLADNGVIQGLLYWDRTADAVRLIRYNVAGNSWEGWLGLENGSNTGLVWNGHTIWNRANMGQGSGLDADSLRGLTPHYDAWNAIAWRDSNGSMSCAHMFTPWLRGGVADAGTLKVYNSGSKLCFSWDGTRIHQRVDEVTDSPLARWGSDVDSLVADPGWMRVGDMYFQWGTINVNNDSCATAPFKRQFPTACLHVVATSSTGTALGGNATLSCHVHSFDRTNLTLCSNESGGPAGTFTVHYFAIGY